MFRINHRQKILLLYLIFIVPLGILCKFYKGPGHIIVSDNLAGSLYVVFWAIFFVLILPHYRSVKIIILVTLATCVIEFSQLLNYKFLLIIRSTFVGRSLIGSTFSYYDFLFYFIGGFMAWFMLRIADNAKK